MNENSELAKKIVKVILDDFTGRRGLSQEWDQIDRDIQKEILQTWREKVKKILDK